MNVAQALVFQVLSLILNTTHDSPVSEVLKSTILLRWVNMPDFVYKLPEYLIRGERPTQTTLGVHSSFNLEYPSDRHSGIVTLNHRDSFRLPHCPSCLSSRLKNSRLSLGENQQ